MQQHGCQQSKQASGTFSSLSFSVSELLPVQPAAGPELVQRHVWRGDGVLVADEEQVPRLRHQRLEARLAAHRQLVVILVLRVSFLKRLRVGVQLLNDLSSIPLSRSISSTLSLARIRL